MVEHRLMLRRWVHYLAFLILVFYVIDTLRTFVFSRQIVRTREVYDSKSDRASVRDLLRLEIDSRIDHR